MPKVGDVKKQFRINQYINLKLQFSEDSSGRYDYHTIIYVGGKPFRQCKYLFLVNPHETIEKNINSIDEAAEHFSSIMENEIFLPKDFNLTAEEEFMAHCSNIQVWVENNYDTRLLHVNLAFPLLKRLYKLGDTKAKRYFLEEIAKRIKNGINDVKKILMEDYSKFLTREVFLQALLSEEDAEFVLELEEMNNMEFIIDMGYTTTPHIKFSGDKIISLNFFNTPITFIPRSIKYLNNLGSITLINTNVKKLPDLNNLKNLKRLTISNSKIQSLPNIEESLMNNKLSEIDLRFNKRMKFKDLPFWIFREFQSGNFDKSISFHPITREKECVYHLEFFTKHRKKRIIMSISC